MNAQTDEKTNELTDEVTASLLELLVAAQNIFLIIYIASVRAQIVHLFSNLLCIVC